MRERDIQGKVVGYARSKGVIALKLDVVGSRGLPDYCFLYRKRVCFMEFKGDSGWKVTPIQKAMIGNLEKQGFDVAVVSDVQHGKVLIDMFVS